MYKEYMKEEYGREVIESDRGFCTYFYNESAKELFVSDIYIKPEFRNTIESKKFMSEVVRIAQNLGCDKLTGIVSLGVKSSERVSKLMRCYLSLGFLIERATNDQIVIRKPLQ